MTTRCLLMPVVFALCALSGCSQPIETLPTASEVTPDEKPKAETLPVAPPPREKADQQNWPKLLVGKWIQIEHSYAAEITKEFTAGGMVIDRISDRDGIRAASGQYQLVDNALTFSEPNSLTQSPSKYEIREGTVSIESISEDKLVLLVIHRTRMTPERAQHIVKLRQIPVGPLLDEVRAERHLGTYERVKNK